MKNPNQIRRNTKRAASTAQPQQLASTQLVRVSLRLPNALYVVVKRGAKRDGLTMAGYVERAIQLVLPLMERHSRKQAPDLSPATRGKLSRFMETMTTEGGAK